MPKKRSKASLTSVSLDEASTPKKFLAADKKYRISGHEGFPCRYAWLPKAVKHLKSHPDLFRDEENAMVALGVGKNMARSIRFWCSAFGIAQSDKRNSYSLTPFGQSLLGLKGFDPFLEDVRTLWLLHWRLSSHKNEPLLAWDYLLNRWQEPELRSDLVLRALAREASTSTDPISESTLDRHFQTFIHTYVATQGPKGEVQEENLDSPFVELQLIIRAGYRETDTKTSRRESIYAFRREAKPEISTELFVYCLCDFWNTRHTSERTLPLSEIVNGHGSPGQIFKLPEEDVRERMEHIGRDRKGLFSYNDSSLLQQITRHKDSDTGTLLSQIYSVELAYA